MLKFNHLQQWLLNSPLGSKVLTTEEVFYHNNIQNIFGYYSLQLALPQIDFLRVNKITSKLVIGGNINCDLRFLPFANDSIDLIICPHVLEYTDNYHHVLQECYRVLIPHGKIIISTFNPKSLLGWFGKYSSIPKQTNHIGINKLQQQLITLNFNICGGKFFCYIPPIEKSNILAHFDFFDKIGDRWFPSLANCYALIAAKEVVTPTRIQPKIKINPASELVPAFNMSTNNHDTKVIKI